MVATVKVTVGMEKVMAVTEGMEKVMAVTEGMEKVMEEAMAREHGGGGYGHGHGGHGGGYGKGHGGGHGGGYGKGHGGGHGGGYGKGHGGHGGGYGHGGHGGGGYGHGGHGGYGKGHGGYGDRPHAYQHSIKDPPELQGLSSAEFCAQESIGIRLRARLNFISLETLETIELCRLASVNANVDLCRSLLYQVDPPTVILDAIGITIPVPDPPISKEPTLSKDRILALQVNVEHHHNAVKGGGDLSNFLPVTSGVRTLGACYGNLGSRNLDPCLHRQDHVSNQQLHRETGMGLISCIIRDRQFRLYGYPSSFPVDDPGYQRVALVAFLILVMVALSLADPGYGYGGHGGHGGYGKGHGGHGGYGKGHGGHGGYGKGHGSHGGYGKDHGSHGGYGKGHGGHGGGYGKGHGGGSGHSGGYGKGHGHGGYGKGHGGGSGHGGYGKGHGGGGYGHGHGGHGKGHGGYGYH
ncbi:uncharacterized protein LOC125046506 [Penaeus chinensis]|uniref:uncharacterized protein LOC125046506 n=1 Tax=Penaeus chinensis TaxID=139456 RepID=UPI001FB600BB|nr:uncharacterized protein LOC125046506 [Penaeus chinensis]